jgi:hypothetical protein
VLLYELVHPFELNSSTSILDLSSVDQIQFLPNVSSEFKDMVYTLV